MNREEEILTILQEECAEVIQAISKMKRFGSDNNREDFTQELADLLHMIKLCYDFNVVTENFKEMEKRMKKKEEKLKKFSKIYE